MEKPTKLNLASGEDYREGYINIDNGSMMSRKDGLDMLADIFTLEWPSDSVEEILLSHFAMYIHISVMPTVLKRWHTWLKKDGVLIIETGDMKKIARTVIDSTDPKIINGTNGVIQLFGWGHTVGHVWVWCEDTLRPLLEEVGFEITSVIDGGLHNRAERDFTIIAKKI